MPYHDKRAVELFFKVMKTWKPDAIDVVGDIDDQLEYSTFSDGTTDEFFADINKSKKINEERARQRESIDEDLITFPRNRVYDVDDEYRKQMDALAPLPTDPLPMIRENALAAREFYSALRAQHKDADIHASLGNHDIRIFKYMDRKAPEIVDELTPNMLWGLDDVGITWRMYHEPPFKRFGDIHVHHGETSSGAGMAVRLDIESYDISLVRGHDHRGGVVNKTYPISGRVLRGMGTGHMCDPSQYGLRYTTNPTWELGFGIGYVLDDVPHLQFIPITPDYKCIVDGKVFSN